MRAAVLTALTALLVSAAPSAASAQALPGHGAADVGAAMRLENERRWIEGQLRALQAEAGRLRTEATVRGLEARRAPDATLALRQAELDAVAADNLARASQAASSANAARLRAADPAYDRSLRALGYATGLPVARR